jgi:ParB-like chromosome segregation protein Spo0J
VTVSQLISILAAMPPTLQVIVSSQGETTQVPLECKVEPTWMRLREHDGIIPGRIDILYCRPDAITLEDGYNVRDLTTPEARAELDELKAQVKEHGVLTPLKIRFDGERIILVEGHRRRAVALELIAEYEASGGAEGRNIESVPIFPEAPGTTAEERDAGLRISNSGSPLKPLELANLIHRMHTVRGLPLEEVAKRLTISMPVLKNHLAMRAMPEEVKEHVREGDISATEAVRARQESAEGTDPIEAARLIEANKEENKKIVGDKKRSTKVTRKTLERNAKPKVAEPPKSADAFPQPTETASSTSPAAPASFSPLSDETPPAPLMPHPTDGAERAAIHPEPMFRDAGESHHETHEQLQTAVARENGHPPAPVREFPAVAFEKPRDGVEGLLLKFLNADVLALATMYAQLVKEHEEARAQDISTAAQIQLCVASDVIGALRFPDEWEQAKANSELAQVA